MKQISVRKWWRVARKMSDPPLIYSYSDFGWPYVVELFLSGPEPEDLVYARTTSLAGGRLSYSFCQKMAQSEWMDYMRRKNME